MANVQVNPGICGLKSTIEVTVGDDGMCEFSADSDCPHVQVLVDELKNVVPYGEIMYADDNPKILAAARTCLPHPSCPVPCALLKTVEVVSGLALPSDASISITA